MRTAAKVMAALLFLSMIGCSGVSTVERAELTNVESREQFVASHPGGAYCENIRNGEIVRGMDIYEVIASWGLPNVYLVSPKQPQENWIYYVGDRDSHSILIYTLTFNDNLLEDWEIDMKRFVDQRVVYDSEMPLRLPTRTISTGTKRK
ncbi:MAG TPA: hypothetical protein ENO08_06230 [Candidatus Eisenbacteria bacterium]|uniref:Outer membrane protein assembly factor BamE n=1 Tax=Eiseniibacteriota bacterium TaxID=2212470 RepID=A0A7V2AVN8_UNCEI|nr:hypothetical protein [Candidatus Eisenbacteria bacterium]